MGYLHIENAYKYPDIFLFKEVYALEKIHGTSAHVRYKMGEPVYFFPGGEKASNFVPLFAADLVSKFEALGMDAITVFGEAYGGKCQGMKDVYGPKLRFVAFDVQIGDTWLSVPNAENVVKKLGLEFVFYEKIPCVKEALDAARDAGSTQARRNGFPFPEAPNAKAVSEGIVIRPLIELTRNDGKRIIAKHKAAEFRETTTERVLDEGQLKVISDARAIAEEWVTPMRLEHVLQKVAAPDISHTGTVIKAMLEDVRRESTGEVEWSKDVEKCVGQRAAMLFKAKVKAWATT